MMDVLCLRDRIVLGCCVCEWFDITKAGNIEITSTKTIVKFSSKKCKAQLNKLFATSKEWTT
jgi:hypothetical protein